MIFKRRYEQAKSELLNDSKICKPNRALFAKFFEYEEYKLKRINGIPIHDEACYKTLWVYTTRLRTVNRWFRNKPWEGLEASDIQQVYDDVEEGRITTIRKTRFKDRQTYYRRILLGKPFELAGKKALVQQIMQFGIPQGAKEVRFIKEEDFRRLVDSTSKPEHRTFLWLCWDVGENGASILKLRKQDCVRQLNEHTGAPEYLIHLRKEILKRSRTPRSEFTNYPETVEYLDRHLHSIDEDVPLFEVGQGWSKKLLLRAVQKTGVRCLPNGQRPTLKDLRSSMACDLLSKGWSRDEINARLGHRPSSNAIDHYITFFALDKVKPRKKFEENRLAKVMTELAEMRERAQLLSYQLRKAKESHQMQMAELQKLVEIHSEIAALGCEYQLGRLPQDVYARRLGKCHLQLLQSREEFDAVASVAGALN